LHSFYLVTTHETTNPVNTACLIQKAVEEHSLVEGYKGDMSMLFDDAYKENVANKSATDMAVLMYNPATLKSGYSLKDEDDEPHEEHDNQDRDKVFQDMTMEEGEIAPLDALYPTMQVLSDGEKQQTHNRMSAMYESTCQEDVKNKTKRDNRSCAKNRVMTALHNPRDRQTHTTGPALMTRTCTTTSSRRGTRRSR
jgi:hypothetical protein